MDYLENYNKIIDYRKQNPLPKTDYGERHHIKPKSIFPELAKDQNNQIRLTAYEHFMAHYYLMEYYWSIGDEHNCAKMVFAINHMAKMSFSHASEDEAREMALLYEENRQKMSLVQKGKPKSPEHRAKISKSMMGNHNGYHPPKPKPPKQPKPRKKRKPMSKEQRAMASKRARERLQNLSQEERNRLLDASRRGAYNSNKKRAGKPSWNKGRKMSEEERQAHRARMKNLSPESRQRMLEGARRGNQNRKGVQWTTAQRKSITNALHKKHYERVWENPCSEETANFLFEIFKHINEINVFFVEFYFFFIIFNYFADGELRKRWNLKIADAHTGKHLSKEHKIAISNGMKGHKHSTETKGKIALKSLESWKGIKAKRVAAGLPEVERNHCALPLEVANEVARQLETMNRDVAIDEMASILQESGFIHRPSTVLKRVKKAILSGYSKVMIINGNYHIMNDETIKSDVSDHVWTQGTLF